MINPFGGKTLAATLATLTLLSVAPSRADVIFRSGFEPDVYTPLTSGRATDIRGLDSTTGFDWDALDAGDWDHYMNYVDHTNGVNPEMLGAQIVTDPENAANKAFYTWQKDGEWQSGGYWSRVQNEWRNISFPEIFYSCRIRIDADVAVVNNTNWYIWGMMNELRPVTDSDNHSINLRVHKDSNASTLTWAIWRKTASNGAGQLHNTGIPVEFNKWNQVQFYVKAGSGTNGRVYLAINGQTGFNQSISTVENGSNLGSFSFLKVYGSIADVVTDPTKGNKQAVKVWFDDVEIRNSRTVKVESYDPPAGKSSAGGGSDLHRVFADPLASGGQNAVLEANASGDWVAYDVPSIQAISYDVYVNFKKARDRGKCQMSVAPVNNGTVGTFTNQGSEQDLYNYDPTYNRVKVASNFTPGTAGTKRVKFTSTGKNGSATANWMSVDYIEFVPTS